MSSSGHESWLLTLAICNVAQCKLQLLTDHTTTTEHKSVHKTETVQLLCPKVLTFFSKNIKYCNWGSVWVNTGSVLGVTWHILNLKVKMLFALLSLSLSHNNLWRRVQHFLIFLPNTFHQQPFLPATLTDRKRRRGSDRLFSLNTLILALFHRKSVLLYIPMPNLIFTQTVLLCRAEWVQQWWNMSCLEDKSGKWTVLN